MINHPILPMSDLYRREFPSSHAHRTNAHVTNK